MQDKFDDQYLKALLSDEIRSSLTYYQTELQDKRTKAVEYYLGNMTDTPAPANRSSVVSYDIADTIGWMLPGIIRVFTASDTMAKYEPMREGSDEFAEAATTYANYIFWKDNDGYRILWDATHDSLLQGNGIVKHYWDDKEDADYEEFTSLTQEGLALLEQDGLEIISHKPGEPMVMETVDPMTGQPVQQQIETFDVKAKRVITPGRVKIECVEPEDFMIDKDATTIEDARFVAHRREVSRSDLIEMGFDKTIVEGLMTDNFSELSQEDLARREEYRFFNGVGDDSMMLIQLYECYVKVDTNGDGIAETVRAYYAGGDGSGELLDWEVWEDDPPFSDVPCEPVPHRWDARSITDKLLDVQRVKTIMLRGLMDNTYWVNNPMTYAKLKSVVNPEMLTAPKFGGVVWGKEGAEPPVPLPIPYQGDKLLMGIQHWDQVAEKRTGVSRSTMALDPEALQNQTATANQNQKDAAYSQIELVARNQAELGWKRVFKQILKLIVKHQDWPRQIFVDQKPVMIDPRSWNVGLDVSINVGLGTGSRDRDMMILNNILQTQMAITDRFAQGGLTNEAVEMIPKIVETAEKIAESAGIKNTENYYPEIDDQKMMQIKQQLQQRAQQPDPKVALEQSKMQMQAQNSQAQMQMDQQKMQYDWQMQQEQMKMNADLQSQKTQSDFQAKMAQMQEEMALKRDQIANELQLKREQLAAELQLKREQLVAELQLKQQLGNVNTNVSSDVRPGGEPG